MRHSAALAFAAVASLTFSILPARAETVIVGALHSLSGTVAISGTSLRDVLLFTFDEVSAAGGVMEKKIEPESVDGATSPGGSRTSIKPSRNSATIRR